LIVVVDVEYLRSCDENGVREGGVREGGVSRRKREEQVIPVRGHGALTASAKPLIFLSLYPNKSFRVTLSISLNSSRVNPKPSAMSL
jgi:hypothetical protein